MHIPVLQKEALEYLAPKANENFVDCTFGQGGHAMLLLEKNGPKGRVLGIEADPELYKKFQQGEIVASSSTHLKRLFLVNDSYTNLSKIATAHNFKPVNGIIVDLGISSWHIEESGRGFSFRKDEPLDMRYNPQEGSYSAFDIINNWPREDLFRIFKDYGEERFAASIAKNIAQKRKEQSIRTTFQLVGVIEEAVPGWYRRKKIHFATKTFQALRIAVNSEIDNLRKVLVQAIGLLEKEGRLAIISFHSLEDREVKNTFKRSQEINILKILTKKPVVPQEQEIADNPRARSAKLRVAKKIL